MDKKKDELQVEPSKHEYIPLLFFGLFWYNVFITA